MRSRLLAAFAVGALGGALLLGGGVFALQAFGDDAQAQSGATWQMKDFPPVNFNNGSNPPDPEAYIDDWVQQLPSECDFLFMEGVQSVVFYRCPAS